MKREPNFWECIESLPTQAAVLADWERALGKEFALARGYLEATTERSMDHPCTHQSSCGCVHRVIPPGKRTGLVAVCECGCPPIKLQDKDLVVYELGEFTLGEAVRRAFGFERISRRWNPLEKRGDPKVIGSVGTQRHSVYLCCDVREDSLPELIDEQFLLGAEPSLLVTMTATYHTAILKAKLRRLGWGLLALSETIELGHGGRLRCTVDIESVVSAIGKVNDVMPSLLPERAVAGDALRPTEQIIVGSRLKYLPGFNDVWLDGEPYDLRKWGKARACLQLLIENQAFAADSAMHLVDEIDPYVREQNNLDPAPHSSIKIQYYFKDGGPLRDLCKAIVKAVPGERRYFLKVD